MLFDIRGAMARNKPFFVHFIRNAALLGRDALLSVPLRLKIMGMALGLVFLFGAVTTYKVHQVLVRNMVSFLQEESRSIAGELTFQVREYLLINDLYGLTQLLKGRVTNRPDLRYVIVEDKERHVLSHTFGKGFPRDMLVHFVEQPNSGVVTKKLLTNEGVIWETYYPIMQGEEGAVRVGVRENIARQRISFFIKSLLWNTLLVAVFGIFLSAFLTWLITRPVKKLVRATRSIRQGDYSVTIDEAPKDEVGKLIEAFHAMAKELKKAEKTRQEKELLRRDFLQRVIAGQEGERKRIARELHDQTGQALASFMVNLKVLEKAASLEDVRQGIGRLKSAVTDEMGAIHDLAVELRPSVLDDMGLLPALAMYVNDFRRRTHIAVDYTVIGFGEKRPNPCVETCIYRIVQESLTNIVRHARADKVKILLEWRQEKIRVVIDDNGRGFDADMLSSTNRLGVYGMRERAELLGGAFRIDAEPGQGAMAVLEIPVNIRKCDE